MYRFSWLIENEIAGLGHPGVFSDLGGDLAALYDAGVRLLVSLTESGVDTQAIKDAGLEALHLPIRDFNAPTTEQMLTFARRALEAVDSGNPVAVHCAAGVGRTGTLLAVYLVARGHSAAKAIDMVRVARPGSIEVSEQEEAVYCFETLQLSTQGDAPEPPML